MKLLIILFSALVMNACGCQKKITENNMKTKIADRISKPKLSGTYIVQVVGKDEVGAQKITLNFDPERNTITGFSGCNTYSGPYTEKEGTLKFGNMMMTKMYCKNAAKTEQNLMSALLETTKYQLKEDILVLASNKKELLTAKVNYKREQLQKENTIVNYVSSTRGYFLALTLQENKLLVRKDRNSEKGEVIAVSNEDMKIVKSLISEIDLKTIDKLESPTKMRHYDGAPHANITITQKGNTYKGAGFDGGHPPKALEALVNKILSLLPKK